jgi:drug/metabolite transporter (DMT)-like permease
MAYNVHMGYVLAALAAACYGAYWVLQQHAAAQIPATAWRSPRRLFGYLGRRPLWLVGLAALIVGSLLQAAGLALGSLAIVEPLLVASLLFALALGRLLYRERVALPEWLGAAAICGALALLMVIGSPTTTKDVGSDPRWLVFGLAAAGGVVLLAMASSRARGAARALLASTASGLTWGICDALTKSALNLAGHAAHAAVALLTAWQTYACAFTALAALALAQVAYNAAPLHISLPSLAAAEPIAGVILGVFVLGERFRASPGSLAVESVCAVMLVLGALPLARSQGLRR